MAFIGEYCSGHIWIATFLVGSHYETMVKHPDKYNGRAFVSQEYKTDGEAKLGHEKHMQQLIAKSDEPIEKVNISFLVLSKMIFPLGGSKQERVKITSLETNPQTLYIRIDDGPNQGSLLYRLDKKYCFSVSEDWAKIIQKHREHAMQKRYGIFA